MSIDRHLRNTAQAVNELWSEEQTTRDRLAALHARTEHLTSERELEPEQGSSPAPPSPGGPGPSRQDELDDPEQGQHRPLVEVNFLTVAETASVLRVSKMTVYRLVHSGHLPAIRVGRSFRVPEQAVHEYLRENWVSAL